MDTGSTQFFLDASADEIPARADRCRENRSNRYNSPRRMVPIRFV
jgi:hypothetical protein